MKINNITIDGEEFVGEIEISLKLTSRNQEDELPVEKIELTEFSYDPETGILPQNPAHTQLISLLKDYGHEEYMEVEKIPFSIELVGEGSAAGLFFNFESLTEHPEIDNIHNATDFSFMFGQCSNLRKVNIGYDVLHNANSTEAMFYRCTSLEEVGELDMFSITNANFMFWECLNLKDDGVRLLNRNPRVTTENMTTWSALTEEPWDK